MLRSIAQTAFLCLLLVAAGSGVYVYRTQNSLENKLRQAEEHNAELKIVVQRLSAERRVADIIVNDQSIDRDGRLLTTLLFVEYDRDGNPLPEKRFVVEGKMAHIDALVVKFDGKFVQQNDPLRGHSIALFTRLYGDKQRPEEALPIDQPNQIPDTYRGADPKVTTFETELWHNFWRLADDPSYRADMGARVVQGEGVWRPFEPGYLYTLTLETNGGLNITSEKLRGIYQALQKKTLQ